MAKRKKNDGNVVNEKEKKVMGEQDVIKGMSEEELALPVTRGEFLEVLRQISENVNDISKYLMEDVNVHFRNYTYPTMIKLQAVMQLMVEKGICDQKELDDTIKRISSELMAKAKEVAENQNGGKSQKCENKNEDNVVSMEGKKKKAKEKTH